LALIFLSFLLLIFLFAKLWKSTATKSGKWGINFNNMKQWGNDGVLNNVECPNCGNQLDTFRKPKNLTEILWGGWTCDECGTSVDKWGNERNK